MSIRQREWTIFRVSFLVVTLLPLSSFLYLRVQAAEESAQPLTTTERLALSSLQERGRVLQEDTRAFYTEVCGRRGIKALEECSIDATAMTIAHVVKPATPPPAPAK